MKKQFTWILTASMLLAGCQITSSTSKPEETTVKQEETSTNKAETTETTRRSITYFTEDAAIFGEPTQVSLQIPKSYSEDNDIIVGLKELFNIDKKDENGEVVKDKNGNPVKEYATMGKEREVTLVYYGSVFTEEQGTAIMLVVNKTGKTIEEFETTIELKIKDQTIIPETTFGYKAEDMGALENAKVIPVTIPIDSSLKETVESASPNDLQLIIKDYKEIKTSNAE